MDSEDKQRVSLYLDKETVKTVDVFIKKHGYRSRNELFETAAKNMIADSALKSSDDILSDKLAKAIENVSKCVCGKRQSNFQWLIPLFCAVGNDDACYRKDKSLYRRRSGGYAARGCQQRPQDKREDKTRRYRQRLVQRRIRPCFAVCRPVCDLLRKDEKVPVKTVRAVLGVCRDL